MKKINEKNQAKTNFVKGALDKELSKLGSGAGTIFFFQPAEPKGIEKFKHVR